MGKIKRGIKMVVKPEQSRKIQEICFENGIEWAWGNYVKHLDKPFLYVNDSHLLGYGEISQEELFYIDKNEEVSAELFIRTNGTCVESGTLTEDNNKGEQMEELKLECLVEGYEGTYFEIGQVWETRRGDKLKVKGFDFRTNVYKLILTEVGDSTEKYYYSAKGEDIQGRETDLNLVKLISTEIPTETISSKESQPKTLSEYLKENNAYENFIENCVASVLLNLKSYECKRGVALDIDDFFTWNKTKEGHTYWLNLHINQPKDLVYDMNEIIFAEVNKRIAEQKAQSEFISTEEFDQMFEQKASTKYMVFVEGRSNPKKVHDSYDSAEKEAKRLSAKEIDCNVMFLSVVKTFKSKVIVEEVK